MSLLHEAGLFERQKKLFFDPRFDLLNDIRVVYQIGDYSIGWPEGAQRIFEHLARPNTEIVVGIHLGDEGKGRIIDNKVGELLSIPGVELVYVIRVQGGNNAGHTSEAHGKKIAQHLVPSGIMHEEVKGIMDNGMIIHPDLEDEVTLIEEKVGDLRGKLILAEGAILSTDLERAEELLNRRKKGDSKGGTGRGISPSYAHHYDRLGTHIFELKADNWRQTFGEQYLRYQQEFEAYGIDLANVDVIDFMKTKRMADGKEYFRKVGSKEEFLDRLESFRTWLLDRDMIQNTFLIHREAFNDLSKGVLVELAQALALHAWLGTRPDVTSSDTSAYSVMPGTGIWKVEDFLNRIGVFKITYMSSVGSRQMPTQVILSKDIKGPADLTDEATPEQYWAAYVRQAAKEFGTTTGRPRDICHLDLELMKYNARMAGIEMLAGTHLDIAREGEDIWVCTHYTGSKGTLVPYQPGLRHQKGVIPHYLKLPGWDGEKVTTAHSFDELPENAKKFLAFIQRRTGYPIVIATTGPDRENYLTLSELPKKNILYPN